MDDGDAWANGVCSVSCHDEVIGEYRRIQPDLKPRRSVEDVGLKSSDEAGEGRY